MLPCAERATSGPRRQSFLGQRVLRVQAAGVARPAAAVTTLVGAHAQQAARSWDAEPRPAAPSPDSAGKEKGAGDDALPAGAGQARGDERCTISAAGTTVSLAPDQAARAAQAAADALRRNAGRAELRDYHHPDGPTDNPTLLHHDHIHIEVADGNE